MSRNPVTTTKATAAASRHKLFLPYISLMCIGLSGPLHAAKIFPLVVNKEFTPSTAVVGGTTEMKITITNPNSFNVSNIALTDLYPSGISNGLLSFARPENTCGGVINAFPGSGQLLLTGATLGSQGSSCAIIVNVLAEQAGLIINHTGSVGGTYGNGAPLPNANDASASLIVNGTIMSAPQVVTQFLPNNVGVGVPTQLHVQLINPNAAPLYGVQFDDAYPLDIENSPANVVVSNTCGGTVTAPPTWRSVGLHNGTIPANSGCEVVVNLIGTAVGPRSNDTGPVLSANGLTNAGASGVLTIWP